MGLPAGLDANAFLPTHVRAELDLQGTIRAGAPRRRAKWVQERLTLAGFAVVIDGDFGPATTAGLKEYQSRKGLSQTGVYGQAEHDLLADPFAKALGPVSTAGNDIGTVTIRVALQHVRQKPREAGGDNKGPWVRMYMDGNEGSEWKWCAGFVFFNLAQACALLGQSMPMRKTFGVDAIVERAKNAGQFVSEAKIKSGAVPKANILPGSLFCVRRTPTDWTHVGLVEKAENDIIHTIEGNTNDDGSANGFEAVARTRNYEKKDFVVW